MCVLSTIPHPVRLLLMGGRFDASHMLRKAAQRRVRQMQVRLFQLAGTFTRRTTSWQSRPCASAPPSSALAGIGTGTGTCTHLVIFVKKRSHMQQCGVHVRSAFGCVCYSRNNLSEVLCGQIVCVGELHKKCTRYSTLMCG